MKILDELIYQEYSNWLMENDELIKFVKNSKSTIAHTFEHVLPVVDYLYNELIDAKEYGEEEDGIFQFGFHFLVFKFDEIKYIFENYCQSNYEKLESIGSTINLLFYTLEFEQALLENENANYNDVEKIIDLEKEVMHHLEKCQNAPAELIQKIDDITKNIFTHSNYEFETVESIFAEIAIGLDID